MSKVNSVNDAEEKVIEVAEAVVVTEDSLKAELTEALKTQDWTKIAAASRKTDLFNKEREKAELAVKLANLASTVTLVASAINKAVMPLYESGELDAADGIWYSYDFGEKAPTIRLTRTAPRTPRADSGSSIGGGNRKFSVGTEALLEKYGNEEYKDGMTFSEAWQYSTDKNWRYAIRLKLLKLEVII